VADDASQVGTERATVKDSGGWGNDTRKNQATFNPPSKRSPSPRKRQAMEADTRRLAAG